VIIFECLSIQLESCQYCEKEKNKIKKNKTVKRHEARKKIMASKDFEDVVEE